MGLSGSQWVWCRHRVDRFHYVVRVIGPIGLTHWPRCRRLSSIGRVTLTVPSRTRNFRDRTLGTINVESYSKKEGCAVSPWISFIFSFIETIISVESAGVNIVTHFCSLLTLIIEAIFWRNLKLTNSHTKLINPEFHNRQALKIFRVLLGIVSVWAVVYPCKQLRTRFEPGSVGRVERLPANLNAPVPNS